MVAREILALLRRQPFPGLRVFVSDGESYKVWHPEMMLVTTTLVHIALPPLVDGVPERSVYCDPIHITGIEPINGRNGKRPRRRKRK